MAQGELVNPLFLALDVDTDSAALELAGRLKGRVGGFKIGPRLTLPYGLKLISQLAELGPVFVDNKYYDIPSTMLSAIQATFAAGASFATIHAQAGPEALTALAQLESELNQERPFRILSVTVLTSYSLETIPPNWTKSPLAEQVEALAQSTIQSGLASLVCSPEEVALLRKKHPNAFLVTPGIRLTTDAGDKGDQKRVMTPTEAIKAGASALVIGRPILKAADPVRTVDEIVGSLQSLGRVF